MQNRWLQALVVLSILAGSPAVNGQALTDDPSIINDHMFAGKAACKPFSDFDSKGFIINGKRTFLVSAGLEYARVPHQLWYDRLLRLKRGGFNCVEIYTLWNFHESREGQFDFKGDKDLGLFLSLVKKLGMYAIVRVGPYYCAEWDHGGYPIWLKFKEGLRVREENTQFEHYVDRFFDQLLPIVFKHQINKGGAVILVQLENEHPKGWGTIMPNNYFKHLQSKSLSMGMDVPYFFSGVHHSTDPAGKAMLDDAKRPNPWFSTEYWSMWYNQYGAKKGDAELYDRRTWKIIAHGGNGYNFYMAYGGSNFGYTNNDEDAASYDYGAAVGQAGDLRPTYYTFKRAGYFARSFQEILENSSDGGNKYQYLLGKPKVETAVQKLPEDVDKGSRRSDTLVKLNTRTSAAGELIFLDNTDSIAHKTLVSAGTNLPGITIHLAPQEIYPLVHNFQLTPVLKMDWALTRIYAVTKQGKTTTILAEAGAGDKVFFQFSASVQPSVITGAAGLKVSGKQVVLNTSGVKGAIPSVYEFKAGQDKIRILVMERSGMDKAWLTETPALNAIVTGVSYLGEVSIKQGRISANAEFPLNAAADGAVNIYLENGIKAMRKLNPVAVQQTASHTQIVLAPWETQSASAPAAPGYDDSKWLSSEDPLQMGADQDITADAWYRAKFSVPETGTYAMQVEGGDRGTLFIDGKQTSKWNIKTGEVSFDISKGEHTMAVFTAHNGRDKMAAYLGPIDNFDKKGISGKVILKKGGPFYQTLENWYYLKSDGPEALKSGAPELDTLLWKKYKIGADAFNLQKGFGWFATIIPAQKGLSKLDVAFKSVDENATVFINGKQVAAQAGWNNPFAFTITDAATLNKPMVLTVFIENYDKEGGIDQAVKINTIGDAQLITGWKMKGGQDKQEVASWKKLNTSVPDDIPGPRFFRSNFTLPELKGKHLIWRVNPDGLAHGSVWVNGHNIGRYPEINFKIGMYIPEAWLKPGTNSLLIYEEEGAGPVAVSITAEEAASRNEYQLISN